MTAPDAPTAIGSVAYVLGRAADVPTGDRWLTDEERAAQERFVVPVRRTAWRLGRWTAKHAVAGWLGGIPIERVGILARGDDDGFPLVRIAGAGDLAPPTVSISHRGDRACALVGPSGAALGCDLELVEPRPDGFAADWFTTAEQDLIGRAPANDRDRLVTLVWSIKESALKALGVGLRADTRDVVATIDDGSCRDGWRPVSAIDHDGRGFAGWWRALDDAVLVVLADGDRLPDPPRRIDGVMVGALEVGD